MHTPDRFRHVVLVLLCFLLAFAHAGPVVVGVQNTSTSSSSSAASPTTTSTTSSIAPTSTSNATNASYRAVGYFGNWDIYGRNYQPAQVPANLLTHLIYAFANIRKDTGEVVLSDTYADTDKHYPGDSWNDVGNNVYGCVKQFYLLKKKNRNFKTMLSIGGWGYSQSGNFDATSTDAGRSLFATSAVNFVKNLGFDGIDIDWEYPTDAGQAQDFVLLLQALRNQFTNYSNSIPGKPHFLISVALPAGPTHYSILQIKQMDAYVDMWNLMAYDYAGSWDTYAGHSSNVYNDTRNMNATPFNTPSPVDFYVNSGVNPSKINLGMPLYGHVFLNTDGPGTPFQGVGQGEWDVGIYDYKMLPLNNDPVYVDKNVMASWSYNNSTRMMVSFDNPDVVDMKIDYIQDKGLGGGMWWDVSGDRAVGQGSLIQQVVQGLGGANGAQMEQVTNILSYPQSIYDNMRNGMPNN